jgi:hypothetical protein
MVQQQPPQQEVIQPVAWSLAGNVTATVRMEVPNPDPTQAGIVNAAIVTFSFAVAVEPETEFPT